MLSRKSPGGSEAPPLHSLGHTDTCLDSHKHTCMYEGIHMYWRDMRVSIDRHLPVDLNVMHSRAPSRHSGQVHVHGGQRVRLQHTRHTCM